MGKKSKQSKSLFEKQRLRPKRALILPRFLKEEADKMTYRGEKQEKAHDVLKRWAKLEEEGHLKKKETALDANFLNEIFGGAFGFRVSTQSPNEWELERNYGVPGIGTADGALGNFKPDDLSSVIAVIELKGAGTDLDRDKFNGRTPVQQCWDYLNALPQCPWGIVSNFVTTRLYHRNKTPIAYEEFHLSDLKNINNFRRFYCLFELGGLLKSVLGQKPRVFQLLEKTENRQREVGDELYETYSSNRLNLIAHLVEDHDKTLENAIHIAQKILDRIIFVAFCEDRGLLPEKTINTAYKNTPPFSKATNPRWQNFLNLFHAVDKGHKSLNLSVGYNGGLFRADPEVDDLQLSDDWTNFFRTVGGYDFRDEVNVDVLGHLFEKSITELEKLRVGGLFASNGKKNGKNITESKMKKSAQRKRFGIYYTPPEFTKFIVKATVKTVVERTIERLRKKHKLKKDEIESDESSKTLGKFWLECLQQVRQITVCDPACGSGAFLIQAYDALEEAYLEICNNLIVHDGPDAENLFDEIPDYLLSENLYGVDLSEQAVEITQLALWIRSARRGKTLADLSKNIVCANSLVTDEEVDPRAMEWKATFPDVFNRKESGFDCVIGNPPWERLKVQEREFFSYSAPKIAGAVSAANRRKMIAKLEAENPDLFRRYRETKSKAERVLKHVREVENFPLTAKGDINTYMLFAELAKTIVAPNGMFGLLVPSGIATDNTTKDYFADLVESESLVSLFDFENKAGIFPDVHRSFKFLFLSVEVQKPKSKLRISRSFQEVWKTSKTKTDTFRFQKKILHF